MTSPAPSPARLLSVFDRLEARHQGGPDREREMLLEKALEINAHQEMAYSPEEVAQAVDEEISESSSIPAFASLFAFGWDRPASQKEWEARIKPRWWKRVWRFPYDVITTSKGYLGFMAPLVLGTQMLVWSCVVDVLGVAGRAVGLLGHPFGDLSCALAGGLLTCVHVVGGVVLADREHPWHVSDEVKDPQYQDHLMAAVQTSSEADRYLMHCLASDVPLLNGDLERLIHLAAQSALAKYEGGQVEAPKVTPEAVRAQLLQRLSNNT